ncbi:putative secretory lipase [Podospora conica]|nr:putative secretory lipase [Schizothecium conicum]
MRTATAALLSLGALARYSAAAIVSTTCNESCQKLAGVGIAYETAAFADPSASFYSVPANFSSKLAPGALLRLEAATDLANYSVPSGLSMSRILYTSSTLNGTTIPASAYILWPYTQLAPSDRDGYPLVAWGHGTSGLFSRCAPSNYRSLQYHWMAPFLLALQGMAVVAPDYAGLGVGALPSGETIGHPWLAAPAQANDLAHAITAARAAFPAVLKPAGPFVVLGHSQGGSAAWAFAEKQAADKPLAGYRGTVSLAPPARAFAQYEDALANATLPFSGITKGLAPKLIAGVTAAFPAYNASGMSEVAADRWFNVLKPARGCFPTDALVFSDVKTPLAKDGWQKHPTVQAYAGMTAVGGRKFKGPLLVLAGEVDAIASFGAVKTAVAETCALGKQSKKESLEFVRYRDVSHFPLIQASQSRWLPWIQARLAGKGAPVPGGCSEEAIGGFRAEFTPHATTPNFLVGWADSATESWKLLL